jgi:hypothetical protein
MIHYTRGEKIVIRTSAFKDSTGGVVFPTSVNITIAYPHGSTNSRWPHDGTELQTTTFAMTTPSTASTAALVGQWVTTWNSAISGAGIVYWTAVPSTVYGISEGKFQLRGGLANPTAVPTTL